MQLPVAFNAFRVVLGVGAILAESAQALSER
jgi:hypothetical protein